jgi:hypothetical protein
MRCLALPVRNDGRKDRGKDGRAARRGQEERKPGREEGRRRKGGGEK